MTLDRFRQLSAVVAWLLVGSIVYSTLSPLRLRPETGFVNPERFGAFAGAGAAFVLAYPRRWPLAFFGLLAGAAALEVLQNLRPDRHGRIPDLAVKAAGVACGAVAGFVASAVLAKLTRPVQRFWT